MTVLDSKGLRLASYIFIATVLIHMPFVFAKTPLVKPSIKKVGLLQIYRDAVNNNADLAVAKAQYQAKQELVPQARAGLLPQITAGANYADVRTALDKPPARLNVIRKFMRSI